MPGMWAAIAVTAESAENAFAYCDELTARLSLGALPGADNDTLLLAVPDPNPLEDAAEVPWGSSGTVGSGGATLNAAIHITEQITSHLGMATLESSVLRTRKALVIHCKSGFPVASRLGNGFRPNPGGVIEPFDNIQHQHTNVDAVMQLMEYLAASTDNGLWVCSTELLLDGKTSGVEWKPLEVPKSGVTAVAFPTSPAVAGSHGVYKVGPDGLAHDILYQVEKGEEGVITPSGKVHMVSPVVYFSEIAAELLLTLHASPPLDACTHDAGADPLVVNLIFDMLLACCPMSAETYIKRVGTKGCTSKAARELLWRTFHSTALHVVVPHGEVPFTYPETPQQYMEYFAGAPVTRHLHLAESASMHPTSTVLHSIVGEGCIVEEASYVESCDLRSGCRVGESCMLIGVTLPEGCQVPPRTALHTIALRSTSKHHSNEEPGTPANGGPTQYITIAVGVRDDPTGTTMCGQPLEGWLSSQGAVLQDVWDKEGGGGMPAARLYPLAGTREGSVIKTLQLLQSGWDATQLQEWKDSSRVSASEALLRGRAGLELTWLQDLWETIDRRAIWASLREGGTKAACLIPIFRRRARRKGSLPSLLEEFDEVLSTLETPRLGRGFSSMAELLAAFAGPRGGLRPGTARNPMWEPAFKALQKGDPDAIGLLAEQRQRWCAEPQLLVRAARHYEGAAAIMTSRMVDTAATFIGTPTPVAPVPLDKWVSVRGPARIDFSGAWTDTPPVCYEYGGVVVNLALMVDGQRPIAAHVRRTTVPTLVLMTDRGRVECTEVSDLFDYNSPLAPAALLKTAILSVGFVTLEDPRSLTDQLGDRVGGGIEVKTQSDLPMGSGLGGSSILGTLLIKALGIAVGRPYDDDSLVHAVLRLEQMLTSGGGWQDQVGGLYPGIKVCRSAPELPLRVTTEVLPLSAECIQKLEAHMVLVYTGRARLARNVLQSVLRRWAARLPEIIVTVRGLTQGGADVEKALRAGDIVGVGHCLRTYWEHKKCMAGSCAEPRVVTQVLAAVQPLIAGGTLGGAGGGGFMVLITNEPNMQEEVKKAVIEAKVEGGDLVVFHGAKVDTEGVQVSFSDNL